MTADVAALVATAMAAVGTAPQAWRVLVGRDAAGVSATSAGLGIATEAAWVGYGFGTGLWTLIPEAVLMCLANVAIGAGAVRAGVTVKAAGTTAAVWALALGLIWWVGGLGALAAVLAGAYALQVAPAVWTVWRTASPTGVVATTWVLVGIEGALWFGYGMNRHDPATTWFGIIAVVAATATVARKVTVALPCQRGRYGDSPASTTT